MTNTGPGRRPYRLPDNRRLSATEVTEWICPVCYTPLLVVGSQAQQHIEMCDGPAVVGWSCPHDPTGTSPYACACEDG